MAFLDRVDIKQFIGNPSHEAIYQILRNSINELMRCGIIYPEVSLDKIRLKLGNGVKSMHQMKATLKI